jgi:hypothetical protein
MRSVSCQSKVGDYLFPEGLLQIPKITNAILTRRRVQFLGEQAMCFITRYYEMLCNDDFRIS